ncbi:MAG: TonB-dependent receptor [Bacteroidales bacterium]|nr:TonB-dependent receptor [Bacteroidales bacterium]
MKEKSLFLSTSVGWKRFSRKAYAVFASLKKEVVIGVLSIMTLTFANVDVLSAQNRVDEQINSYSLEEVEVIGTRVPLTQQEMVRQVIILSQDEIQRLNANSVNDLLKLIAPVDIRQRSAFGIQTDLSIRGGTFDQLTLLLNGININNPQTGHLNLDLPVSVDQIERIEILQGPAARIYGTSAFSGAVNIITKQSKQNGVSFHLKGGQYGSAGGGTHLSFNSPKFTHQLSGNYHRSDGAVHNSDFKQGKGFYQGEYALSAFDLNWQLGVSDQKYGANTFYSASYPNQYEETRRYFVALQGETKGAVQMRPVLYWNRSFDHYQLIKAAESGENFHRNDVYGVGVNGSFASLLGKTGFGAEVRTEGLLSSNMGEELEEGKEVDVPGHHGKQYSKKVSRTNVSYFVEHNFMFSTVTLSTGVLATMNTGLDQKFRFYPGIDLSYRPTSQWKLFVSWNKALRLPTFTDLFYKSPTQVGDKNLKPERTDAYSVGGSFKANGFRAEISTFYQRGREMIDWVMFHADDIYHSTNLLKLNNYGFDASFRLFFPELFGNNSYLTQLSLNYAYLHQDKKDSQEIYKSNYALEYLRHKFIAQLSHRIYGCLQASWSIRWQDRMGGYLIYDENLKPTKTIKPYGSYALVDLKLEWSKPKYVVYAAFDNLLNRKYYDYGNVPQPGFWFNGGVKININW